MMYVVIGLLSIFFIVLLIFSVKTWRALHVVSVVFVFLAAGVFVYLSAAMLRTQTAWRTPYNKLEAKIKAADEEIELLREGETDEEDLLGSVRHAKAALDRLLQDRPSLWRNCTPQLGGGTVRLTIPPQSIAAAAPADEVDPDAEPADGADPADPAPPAAAGARHNLTADKHVYAFLEGPSELSGDLNGHVVPKLYLGDYKVTAADATSVTLAPSIKLTALQEASLDAGNWTIYDKMPIDSPLAFEGLSEEDLKAIMPQEGMGLATAEYDERINTLYQFFAGLAPAAFPGTEIPASAAALARIVPIASVQMDAAEYQAVIDSYLRDGEKFDDAKDPPDREWVRVEFKSPTSIQVDTVLQDLAALASDSNYESNVVVAVRRETGEVLIGEQGLIVSKGGDADLGQLPLGISVNDPTKLKSDWEITELWDTSTDTPTLRPLGELTPDELESVRDAKSVEFEIDEVAVVDPLMAEFLVRNDVAQKVEAVFVRQLRDYPAYFNDSSQQAAVFQTNALALLQDTVTLVEAGKRAAEQETFRSDEIGKLREDRTGFEREVVAITGVLAKVEAHRETLNARLSQLYNNNVALARKIFKLQLEQAAKIERGVTETAVSVP